MRGVFLAENVNPNHLMVIARPDEKVEQHRRRRQRDFMYLLQEWQRGDDHDAKPDD